MSTTTISALVNLINDWPFRFKVTGSDDVSLLIGEEEIRVELLLDYGGINTVLELGQDAIAEMDASYAREQAEDQGRRSASSAP